MPIPRIIHQTVADKKALPSAFAENISTLRDRNPGWQHRLYDDEDIVAFIAEAYDTELLKTYFRINAAYGAARADLFRYLLLYKIGGVYLDIKSTCTRPLDEAIRPDDTYLLSHWKDRRWGRHPDLGEQGEFQQWHMEAQPQHPFLQAVIGQVRANIDAYNPSRHGVGRLAVFRMTGPIAYSLAIESVRQLHAHRQVEAEDLGFQYSIFGIDPAKPGHESLFARHYAQQREPLVALPDAEAARKIGRNELCPCGSGERYKRCHGLL
jgi:inositol phosphorylceramide mannosyltransferase catalytic subunit